MLGYCEETESTGFVEHHSVLLFRLTVLTGEVKHIAFILVCQIVDKKG